MAHKGVYLVENKHKYKGNPNYIFYRSSWEASVMKWLDKNKDIKYWNSEGVIIPYLLPNETKKRRYYMDFYVEKMDGKKFLIEVKPDVQTRPPKLPKSGRATKSYKNAKLTYTKNAHKWRAAQIFAEKNGIEFVIWTEHTLKKLGIKVIA